MKRQNRIFLLFLLAIMSLPCLLFAQTIELFGKQTKRGQRFSAKLESHPTEIPATAVITKVERGRSGFWINKKEDYRIEMVHKFIDPQEAVGKTLEAGIYTVYPAIPSGEEEETVTVYVQAGGQSGSSSSSAIEQYQYIMDNYYDKISQASGKQRITLCEKAIEGFQTVIDSSEDPYAITTKQSAIYYKAQCYRLLGDKGNYEKSLEACLEFLPDVDESNESTISYMMSVHLLAKRELDELQGGAR